jgi:hypothetical protein
LLKVLINDVKSMEYFPLVFWENKSSKFRTESMTDI